MELPIAFYGLLFLYHLTLWLLKSSSPQSKNKYPGGPKPLGIIGNFFTLRRLQTRPDWELMNIARKWGDLCLLWAGRHPVIIVNKPQAIKNLLVDRGVTYSSRPEPNNFRSSVWPWRLVIIPAGKTFRFLRKLYHDLLSLERSLEIRKYQDDESIILLSDLLNQPSTFLKDIERYSLSVIFTAVYGLRVGELDHPIVVELFHLWDLMLQHLQPGSLLVDYLPVLQRLPLYLQPGYAYATNLRKRELRFHFAFLRNLQDAVQRGQAPECFGKRFITIQEEQSIDDSIAVDILAMLVAAGGHTTSSILQTFFKVMALHPAVVRKAHLELDRVVGPNRLPSWEDQANLPYIRSLLKELHRWGGLATLGVPHATTHDDVYLGRWIPKGAAVIPNLTSLNRDPERYPEPDLFEPERFMNDDCDAASSANHCDYLQRDHFNYGFGRRQCPGIYVAEASLFIVVSRVLWAFDIHAKPGHVLDMGAKIDGLVTKPKPFEVDIRSRGPRFSKIISEASSQAQLRMESCTLDMDGVVVADA